MKDKVVQESEQSDDVEDEKEIDITQIVPKQKTKQGRTFPNNTKREQMLISEENSSVSEVSVISIRDDCDLNISD